MLIDNRGDHREAGPLLSGAPPSGAVLRSSQGPLLNNQDLGPWAALSPDNTSYLCLGRWGPHHLSLQLSTASLSSPAQPSPPALQPGPLRLCQEAPPLKLGGPVADMPLRGLEPWTCICLGQHSTSFVCLLWGRRRLCMFVWMLEANLGFHSAGTSYLVVILKILFKTLCVCMSTVLYCLCDFEPQLFGSCFSPL